MNEWMNKLHFHLFSAFLSDNQASVDGLGIWTLLAVIEELVQGLKESSQSRLEPVQLTLQGESILTNRLPCVHVGRPWPVLSRVREW